MHPHRILNIGILAHVDAGKTSLTERLLFDTGAIDTLGSVDAGTTRTDTGEIERQRGITVRSAVASFTHGVTQVNVIDTPGHADFVAEVDRALVALDAAVLVVSAVEGVQSHTRILMRILRETGLPTIIFVNKIDRHGARTDSLIAEIGEKLTPRAIAMATVRAPGTRSAQVVPETFGNNSFRDRVAEQLADVDDSILARVVDGPALSPVEVVEMLSEQIANARTYPLYFGSSRTGQGIAALVDGITGRLHAALQIMAEHDPLLHARQEPDGTSSILLYGEIQKEIIATTLANDFGIDSDFQVSEPICIERVTGNGEATEEMRFRAPSPSGFWATVGLRIEPAPPRSGVSFRRETELGALPRAFHTAIEESVYARLRNGPTGRAITDCIVTLARTGFAGPVTTAADFRGLVPIVLDRALDTAGTQLLEPYHSFEIDIPAETFTPVTAYLAGLAANIDTTTAGPHTWQLRGVIPARHIHAVQHQLADLTHGDGTWSSQPADYRPAN
ncbi:GTP-binding protein [Nocardia sp. SYP-A9097]|uniref:GTP-binding protein n=1 Tax=Nocardia sp. SYP-A9097 TaxID=2663237 RepID=UPI00129A4F82|nr:GTP-binding protein [Nocardia sp. SYP-A9097]MRH88574.1 GTP-binding protein [Nocardia sp. SYP-A9097]